MIEQFAILALSLALLSGYAYRADFSKYSIATVGVFKRLKRDVVTEPEATCAELYCEEETDVMERRRFYKEIVVAGMPLVRYDRGEAHYCEHHVSFEVRDELDSPTKSRIERIGTPLVLAFIHFLEWKSELQQSDDEPFENVTSTPVGAMSDAMRLAPILLLVLFATLVLKSMKRARL